MPLADFFEATGTRIMKGATGRCYHSQRGAIYIRRGAAVGIDESLWDMLKHLVEELGVSLHISSIDTGKHAKTSRHHFGCAADVFEVGNGYEDLEPCVPGSRVTERIVRYLFARGVLTGEGRPTPAVLFGPPRSLWNRSAVDHSDHLHLSIPRPRG